MAKEINIKEISLKEIRIKEILTGVVWVSLIVAIGVWIYTRPQA